MICSILVFIMTAKIFACSLANFYNLSISGQTHKFIIYAIMMQYYSHQIKVSRIFASLSSCVSTSF